MSLLNKKRSVLIATPAHSTVEVEYMASVIKAIRVLEHEQDAYNIDLQLLRGESLITRARCSIFSWFLETGQDDLLFIDADVVFEPEHVRAVLESGYDVCSIPYPKKETHWDELVGQTPATAWDAYRMAHGASVVMLDGYQGAIDSNGFAPAKYLSTGFMRISRDAALAMVAAYPELAYTAADGSTHYGVFNTMIADGQLLGEDYSFCKRWSDLGGGLYCQVAGGAPLWHRGAYADVF